MLDLRGRLDEGILVGDGAIGTTVLAERGLLHPCNEAPGSNSTPTGSMSHLAGDMIEAVT